MGSGTETPLDCVVLCLVFRADGDTQFKQRHTLVGTFVRCVIEQVGRAFGYTQRDVINEPLQRRRLLLFGANSILKQTQFHNLLR